MKNLLKYLGNYKKEAVIGPLFKMLEAAFELLVPVVMARIIDVGIRNQDRPYIWRMCFLLIFFGVLGLCCSLTAQYFAAKAALGFSAELRSDLYRHINRFSYHELDRAGTAALVTRMTGLLKKTQLLAGRISAMMNPLTYALVNGAIIWILLLGGGQVYSGSVTQGEMTALVNYMMQILLALVALANLIVTVTRALASAVRVNDVFAMEVTMTDEGNTVQKEKENSPRVAFKQVTFAYDHAKEPSLSDISFEAWPGETIGIIGGTGSGKTTLVSLISRFYDCQEGRVEVDGRDVRQYPFRQLRRKVAMVPQKAVLFAGTIRQNLMWGKEDATTEEMEKALKTAQALDFVREKPEGLDTAVAPGGKNFSGGQRQRLTIARALTADAPILILDDSSSALDFATDAALRRELRENTQGKTVFLVSQRVAAVQSADRILVLDDGHLAGQGSHSELLADCPVYREICLSQLSREEVTAYEQ